MTYEELQKFKEAADKIARECNTPEKARDFLIKTGFLDADGKVSEKFR
jgi:hypothetical protein